MSAGRNGSTASLGLGMDVEYIQPKIAVVSQDPDLTVRITSGATVTCLEDGTCNVAVNFEITNISTVPVTKTFEVLVEAEEVPSITFRVDGLGPGASLSGVQVLGPGDNCFNPNCTVRVTVDPSNVIQESNEANNVAEETTLG